MKAKVKNQLWASQGGSRESVRWHAHLCRATIKALLGQLIGLNVQARQGNSFIGWSLSNWAAIGDSMPRIHLLILDIRSHNKHFLSTHVTHLTPSWHNINCISLVQKWLLLTLVLVMLFHFLKGFFFCKGFILFYLLGQRTSLSSQWGWGCLQEQFYSP